jgi:hypothetical protein
VNPEIAPSKGWDSLEVDQCGRVGNQQQHCEQYPITEAGELSHDAHDDASSSPWCISFNFPIIRCVKIYGETTQGIVDEILFDGCNVSHPKIQEDPCRGTKQKRHFAPIGSPQIRNKGLGALFIFAIFHRKMLDHKGNAK